MSDTETEQEIKQSDYMRRLEAAEEVCWTLLLMMHLGGIDGVGDSDDERTKWRGMLSDPMQKWVDIAHVQGLIPDDKDEENSN